MIIAAEEKKSHGPLIVFIDLLFLLVAFFTLLLFFIRSQHEISEKELESVQQSLARIIGEEVNVPEALAKLETVVERFMAEERKEVERERLLAERRRRRARRPTFKLEYTLNIQGGIEYEGRAYTVRRFLEQVVQPLRKEHWVAFRAYAASDTPFGRVVDGRRILLKDSNEFDTYWDNVTRTQQAAGNPR